MQRRARALALVGALLLAGACSDDSFHASSGSRTTTSGANGGASTPAGQQGGSDSGAPCPCPEGRSASGSGSHSGGGATGGGATGSSPSTAAFGDPSNPSQSTLPGGSTTTVPCSRADTNNRFDVSYGSSDLDIYPVAHGCATPIVVFVHGGGYCCGDKRDDIGSSIPWFHSQGWAVVSVNYRLHVQYPAFDDDVASALAWLHANASSFGGNANRIALFGHSTGAEMVAEIGTTPALQAASGGVACVAALDGYAYDIAATMARISATGQATYRAAYGTSSSQWHAASAVTYATSDHHIPSFLVVLRGGEGGSLLPLQQDLVSALRGAGVSVQTIDAHSIGHGQVIHDIGRSGDTVMTGPVQAFLQRCV